MSFALFDRQVQVTFGKPGQAGLLFSGLRVQFKVEKTGSSIPNKAEIKVFNLSRANRRAAEEKDTAVILRAGYGEDLEDIFKGYVARAITTKVGPDYITSFETGDGELTWTNTDINQTFAAGTNLKDVFSTIAGAFGLPAGDTSGVVDQRLISPLTLAGPARKHLDDLAARQGAEWSIQDESLQFIVKGQPTREEAVLVTPETGLISIPKKKIEAGKSSLELKTLLIGKIRPGRAIQLKSQEFDGVFRCEKVVHQGDSMGQEFHSIIEAVPV